MVKSFIYSCFFTVCLLFTSQVSANETKVTGQFVTPQVININTATVADLQMLKGVGRKKAQAIVDYRQKHGNFDDVEGLTEVKGIGLAILEQNRNLIKF